MEPSFSIENSKILLYSDETPLTKCLVKLLIHAGAEVIHFTKVPFQRTYLNLPLTDYHSRYRSVDSINGLSYPDGVIFDNFFNFEEKVECSLDFTAAYNSLCKPTLHFLKELYTHFHQSDRLNGRMSVINICPTRDRYLTERVPSYSTACEELVEILRNLGKEYTDVLRVNILSIDSEFLQHGIDENILYGPIAFLLSSGSSAVNCSDIPVKFISKPQIKL